ncbi:MAG: YceI family protein [Acidobacteria bacterium]|nr:YceI family protein [Acidobacteriota bacterium]
MKTLRNAIVAAALAALVLVPYAGRPAAAQGGASKVAYAPIPAGDYKIDPAHSRIGFAVRHLEINWVEGRFKDFQGTIHFDDKDVTKSAVEFTAKVASVDTEVEARDKHLRTADFFDAEKYPEMTFKSTSVERKGKSGYVLRGDLTIKGVTKPVALPFTVAGAVKDPWGNTRFGVEAETKINRRDFGINYGNAFAGGLDVGNEVTVTLQLEAVLPGQKPAGE